MDDSGGSDSHGLGFSCDSNSRGARCAFDGLYETWEYRSKTSSAIWVEIFADWRCSIWQALRPQNLPMLPLQLLRLAQLCLAKLAFGLLALFPLLGGAEMLGILLGATGWAFAGDAAQNLFYLHVLLSHVVAALALCAGCRSGFKLATEPTRWPPWLRQQLTS